MTRFERWFLHLSAALLGGSGVLFGAMKYFLEPLDPYAAINHPLQPWALAAHVLAAPFTLFAVGIIVKDHIWAESRRRNARNRRTGLASSAAFALCAISGYLLQTTTGDTLRMILVGTHLLCGGVFILSYGAHLVLSRTGRRAQRRRATPLVSHSPARYNSSEQTPTGDPTPSVEGWA